MSSQISTPRSETTVPPLREGDRLSRAEFERRYLAMPEVNKAELIDGVVYMPSPVRFGPHAEPHLTIATFLGTYLWLTPRVRGGDNGTIRLQGDNEVQPDAFLIVEKGRGGRAVIDSDDYITGGPELVVEVADSSVSIDRNAKFRLYRDNGVREYVLWRTEEEAIDWFILREGRFDPLPLTEGIYKSEVFPGLWLNPEALIRHDGVALNAVLQQGLASPEHAAFVTKLHEAVTG